jgi:hypothetical protein
VSKAEAEPEAEAEAVLNLRDLNRAALARQMLLERQPITVTRALHNLLAVQGQLPRAPFVGLWSRLTDFAPASLRDAIRDRQVVRATMLRGTLHLMLAEDLLAFRASLRTEAALTLPGGKRWTAADLEPTLQLAREHFREPNTFESLRDRIEGAGFDEIRFRAYAARLLLPLVQANSDAPYGFGAGGEFVLADTWLSSNVAAEPQPAELVRRYLAAWGPSTPADFAAWSGMKGVAPWFEALGNEVVLLRDDRKRALYDLRDAPRPGADVPAAPRLLPDFDGVMLGWQDRTRMISAEDTRHIANRNLQIPAVVLLDGFVGGTWRLERKRKSATLSIRTFRSISRADRRALESEALALLGTFEPNAAPEVSFT